jgi:hypothetical protein
MRLADDLTASVNTVIRRQPCSVLGSFSLYSPSLIKFSFSMGVKFSRIIRYKIKHVLNSNKTIYSFGRGTNDSWPYGRRLHENTHYPYILPHDLNEVDR